MGVTDCYGNRTATLAKFYSCIDDSSAIEGGNVREIERAEQLEFNNEQVEQLFQVVSLSNTPFLTPVFSLSCLSLSLSHSHSPTTLRYAVLSIIIQYYRVSMMH